MLGNTPLDAGMSMPEDARPAGEWLEGYWRQTQPWAVAAAWLCWMYSILQLYLVIRSWWLYWDDALTFSIAWYFVGILAQVIPVALIGYFLFQFAGQLKLSLDATDQAALEMAFQQLWRVFLLTVIAAGYLILGWIVQIILYFQYTLAPTF